MTNREKVATLITRYKVTRCSTNAELEKLENDCVDQILSLPPTLSAEKLDEIFPKKQEIPYIKDKNDTMEEHAYKYNKALIYNQARQDCKSALLSQGKDND
jgi:hypothetical protein